LPAVAVKPEVVLRKTEYVTPSVVLAVQLRLIWLDETAVGVSLVGAAGKTGTVAATVKLKVAMPDWPVVLVAVSVMEKVPATIGVPEMTAPVRARPAGRGPVLNVVPAWFVAMM
jgi:hypothetical protein